MQVVGGSLVPLPTSQHTLPMPLAALMIGRFVLNSPALKESFKVIEVLEDGVFGKSLSVWPVIVLCAPLVHQPFC